MIAEFVAPADWHAVDFISDLHLSSDTPRTFDAWSDHMRHTDADAVFILGDLFEAWVGDDMREAPFEAACVDVLRAAARQRVVGFMAGNRDFLVGPDMLSASGMVELADPTRMVAFDAALLVTHGDALCLDDHDYQRFRALVRDPAQQQAFLERPLAERLAIGRATRHASEQRRVETDEQPFVDLDVAATVTLMRDAGVATLIHGHTHRPGSSELAPGLTRHVLTDWELDHASRPRAEVLRWQASGLLRMAPARGDLAAS
ncbi:UDP-2,3-diacylglucosamine diphosphatase [Piscinibacter koreensis]|uniref:UDP-2,3-diacylglucosamine hydrolase n=1 Tax=Piscinibacter koreensis TaxID=2742824 RepID=A0A7Y6NQT3_9BURK|nr:UDP-2,3-diacylglucosamine diphosphatase [Schlegelella koreensis]NUZ07632.1 UDP-2,3-diacylglucosamine diphosphatase [Schlegelella koreensis]